MVLKFRVYDINGRGGITPIIIIISVCYFWARNSPKHCPPLSPSLCRLPLMQWPCTLQTEILEQYYNNIIYYNIEKRVRQRPPDGRNLLYYNIIIYRFRVTSPPHNGTIPTAARQRYAPPVVVRAVVARDAVIIIIYQGNSLQNDLTQMLESAFWTYGSDWPRTQSVPVQCWGYCMLRNGRVLRIIRLKKIDYPAGVGRIYFATSSPTWSFFLFMFCLFIIISIG